MIFIAPISGMITDKKGVVLPTVIGNIICIISLVLITFTTNLSHGLEIFIVFAVYGLGCGLLQSPINKAIMVSVPEKYAGTASGVIPTSRSLGISFAVCYGGLILSYAVPSKTLEQETLFGVAAQELTVGLHYVAILGIILCILVIILSIAGRPEKKSYES
ncbi:MAG: MFS transporter, partial [Methanobrevibacter sp.]